MAISVLFKGLYRRHIGVEGRPAPATRSDGGLLTTVTNRAIVAANITAAAVPRPEGSGPALLTPRLPGAFASLRQTSRRMTLHTVPLTAPPLLRPAPPPPLRRFVSPRAKTNVLRQTQSLYVAATLKQRVESPASDSPPPIRFRVESPASDSPPSDSFPDAATDAVPLYVAAAPIPRHSLTPTPRDERSSVPLTARALCGSRRIPSVSTSSAKGGWTVLA
jgi:hypothetical protein